MTDKKIVDILIIFEYNNIYERIYRNQSLFLPTDLDIQNIFYKGEYENGSKN